MPVKIEKVELNPSFVMACAAMLVALAALYVSLSGFATASSKTIVRRGEIAPGAVTAKALAKGSVTAPKIRKAAVTAPKLAGDSVTASKLAGGSVTGSSLADGSVTASKLGAGSVTPPAIAAGSVTGAALAPHAIGGAQLGEAEVILKPIADLDKIAHNGEWTASNSEAAVCKPGARLMGAGFAFSTPTNGEASWLEAMPVVNGEVNGVLGRFTSDAGGAAGGNIAAICLK